MIVESKDYKPEFVMFLENFGEPNLLENSRFKTDYELIMKQNELPGYQIQPYYIFARINEN